MTLPVDECQPAGPVSLPQPPTLSKPQGTALFLDFDGTLVDIAPRPDAIEVAEGLPGLLTRLNQWLDGRLAVISGRALADLDRHLGPVGVAMAGSHGGEFRASPDADPVPLADPLPDEVLAQIQAISERLGGLLVEAKPFSAAIHYRDRQEAEHDVLQSAEALAHEAGIRLKRGKMVAELVMPGSDKGSAVERFMAMPQFAGSRPLFAGDDVTDEDAFKAVLGFGGGGILVGPERETAALWRLARVPDVHRWLEGLLEDIPQ